ncbi:MAG: sigma-70 family RNA polymerase sigma factor [Verrucomicrobiota bacterium]
MVDAPDDAELLKRYARERDEGAFAEMVRRYVGLVYHAALRQVGGEVHRAEEVAQEVFTRLARKAAALGGHDSLAGWLHTTTRFAARENVRAERRRRAREQEAFLMNETTAGSRDPEWERLRPAIDEALGELEAHERDVVLWRYFVGLSWREIAARLGGSENAARMRGDRALERLQGRLARRGLTSTAAVLSAGLVAEASAGVPAGLAGSVTSGALAGAVAATSGAGLAGFMSASKLGWAAGIAVLASLLGTAVFQEWAAASELSRAQVARVESERLAAELKSLSERAGALEKERAERARAAAALAKPTQQAGANAANTANAGTSEAESWDAVAQGRALMNRYPALKDAIVKRSDAIHNFRYGPVIREMGLTPEQEARFRELVRTQDGIGSPVGPKGELVFFSAGNGLTLAESNAGVRELVGEANYQRMGEFLRRHDARDAMAGLAGTLTFSEAPLSVEQAQRLLGIMLGSPKEIGAGPKGFDWGAITAQAAGVLTPAQMDAFARMRASREAREKGMRSAPIEQKKGGVK